MTFLVSRFELAEVFGKDPRTITTWANKHGMPVAFRHGPGIESQYDTVACIEWLVEHRLYQSFGGSSSETYNTRAEESKLKHYKAKTAELEYEERAGDLIPAAEVQEAWISIVSATRSRLLDLPRRIAAIAPGLDTPRELEDEIRNEVYTALDELASNGGG